MQLLPAEDEDDDGGPAIYGDLDDELLLPVPAAIREEQRMSDMAERSDDEIVDPLLEEALVPGSKRKTPPEFTTTPRAPPPLRDANPNISDYDASNEASNGLILNVPNNVGRIDLTWPKLPATIEPDAKGSYEHLFNLTLKYEQAKQTISGQSIKIAATLQSKPSRPNSVRMSTELTPESGSRNLAGFRTKFRGFPEPESELW
ncbi:hypothetical protein CF319_g9236 [Tilletia indica]|nr:hypothetical protein CF319_g9236 [Tilletia indica]